MTLHIGDQAGTGAESLLKAAGLLSQLPFKATWADFSSGPPMLQAMGAGAVDIGGVGDAPPVFAAAGGAKITIVGATENGPNSAALVVPKGSPITSISQLRGKTIAVAQGSSADYHLLTVLEKAGLTVHDVTLDYLQPAEGLAALESGKVDAWDIWTPYIEEVVGEHGARVLVNGNGFGAKYSFVVASRAALANPGKAAAIGIYLTDLDKAYLWEKNHASAWATNWAQGTGLPLTIMEQATKDESITPVPVTSSVITAEQGLVNAFYSAGLIPTKFNFADYSYEGFNPQVLKVTQ
ncbi:MAG TPA: ABC transporter substrate-binding protein [Acidimicrobiales bacterium]|nr:ABC transporter substrate-binding protein [Acidimicrobiales bacterium]